MSIYNSTLVVVCGFPVVWTDVLCLDADFHFTGQRGLEMLYSYLEISVYDSVQCSKESCGREICLGVVQSSLSQLFDFRIIPPSPIIALIYTP